MPNLSRFFTFIILLLLCFGFIREIEAQYGNPYTNETRKPGLGSAFSSESRGQNPAPLPVSAATEGVQRLPGSNPAVPQNVLRNRPEEPKVQLESIPPGSGGSDYVNPLRNRNNVDSRAETGSIAPASYNTEIEPQPLNPRGAKFEILTETIEVVDPEPTGPVSIPEILDPKFQTESTQKPNPIRIPPSLPSEQPYETVELYDPTETNRESVPSYAYDSIVDAPLRPESGSGTVENSEAKEKKVPLPFDLKSVLPVFGSLALVLGCFFFFAMLMRKMNPQAAKGLPKEAFEVIGKTQLNQKMQLHLIRIGSRLVMVAVTQDGVQPITEITEPNEVVQILGILKKNDGKGSSAAFNKILDEYANEPVSGGYFGAEQQARTQKQPKRSRRVVEDEPEEEESLASILAGGAGGLISGAKRTRSHAARSYAHG